MHPTFKAHTLTGKKQTSSQRIIKYYDMKNNGGVYMDSTYGWSTVKTAFKSVGRRSLGKFT